MNITFLYPPISASVTGGGKVHFQQIAKHLAQAGHKLAVMTDLNETIDFKRFKPSIYSVIMAQQWTDCFYARIRPTGTIPFRIPKMMRITQAILRKPVVWEINAPIYEGVILGKFDKLECQRREGQLRETARQISGAICVSREIQEYSDKVLGISNAKYVPNGGDLEPFKNLADSNTDPLAGIPRPIYFWMGSGELPWEGDKIMIELATRLAETGRPGTVVLAGTPRPEITATPDNVRRIGRVPHGDLPQILANSNICFALYDTKAFSSHGYDFYNSPLKLYEYMSAGKPIIATKAGEITRTIEHLKDGILSENNLDEILESIDSINGDKAFADSLGKNAQMKMETQFSWAKAAADTTDLLRSL